MTDIEVHELVRAAKSRFAGVGAAYAPSLEAAFIDGATYQHGRQQQTQAVIDPPQKTIRDEFALAFLPLLFNIDFPTNVAVQMAYRAADEALKIRQSITPDR